MNKTLRIFALLALCLISVTLFAEDYVLKLGNNSFPSMSVNATFTATEDCNVSIEAAAIYTVKHEGTEIAYKYTPSSLHFSYVYEIKDVKTGDVITMQHGFVLTPGIYVSTYTGAVIPVEMTGVTPAADEVFSWSRAGQVSIGFNKEVAFDAIQLVAGKNMYDVDEIQAGTSIGFNITNALNNALHSGAIQPGDKFSIAISNLRDAKDATNLYNGHGRLVITYQAPYPQAPLTSVTVGEGRHLDGSYTFLSYYSPEEKDGLFVFEFGEQVKSVDDVALTMGNLDLVSAGKYHRSSVPFTIDGNKILVDARGTLRTLKILFPAVVEEEPVEGEEINEGIGEYDTEHIALSLTNVIDIHGNPFLSGGSGSVGSYAYIMNYKELVDDASIDGDNIAEGDEVKGGQEIRLWLSNPNIKFKGIEVTYFVSVTNPDDEAEAMQEPRTVVVTDYTTTPDPYEGIVISFNLPDLEGIVAGTTVTATLYEASSPDGMPHDLHIEFKAAAEEPAPAVEADFFLTKGQNIIPDSLTFRSVTAAFIADKDGKVLIEAQEAWNVNYDSIVCPFKNIFTNGHGAYVYEIDDVKAGTAIMMQNDFVINTQSAVWVTIMEPGYVIPVTMTNVVPAAEEVFSWYRAGQMSIAFNKEVLFDKIQLVAGKFVADVDDIHGGYNVGFNITEALNEALRSGAINPGDAFNIVISNLRDAANAENLYDGRGRLTVKFIAPYPQSKLESVTVAGKPLTSGYDFLSWYAADAEDGVFTFEFGDTVKSIHGVEMSIGSLDASGQGRYHRSSLPYVIDGNKVIVDARGKLRSTDVLFPVIEQEEPTEEEGEGVEVYVDMNHVTISLSNVIDKHNNPFQSPGSGSVGSYAYVMNYKELRDEASLDGNNVYAGDDIVAGQEVSLWLSNPDIHFQEIQVTSGDNVLGWVTEFAVTPDEFEGVIITFTMPDMNGVKVGDTIVVTLGHITSPDGRPHELSIEFKVGNADTITPNAITEGSTIYTLGGIRTTATQSSTIYIINGKKILK